MVSENPGAAGKSARFDPLERIRGLNGPFLRQDIAHPPDEPGRGRAIYPPAGVCQKRPASLSGYCPVGNGPPGAETPGHDDQDEGFSSVRRPIRMGGSWEGAISGQKGWHRMGIRSYTAAFGWLIGWRAAQSAHRIKICAGGKATTRARSAPGLRTRCAVHCSIGVRGDQVHPIKMRRVRPRGHIPMPDRRL